MPALDALMLDGVEMHGGHNSPLPRHNADGTNVAQWHTCGIPTNAEEGTTGGTRGNEVALSTRHQAVFAVMLDTAELELEPGTKACESDALSCVLSLLGVLEPLANKGTLTDIYIVPPHDLHPVNIND